MMNQNGEGIFSSTRAYEMSNIGSLGARAEAKVVFEDWLGEPAFIE